MKPTAASPQAARVGAMLPLLALAVGAYAIGVMVGAPLMTLALSR
jgi:predicted MFS family arabinose efflux permease